VEESEIPERMKSVAEEKRAALLESLAEFDEQIMEKLLEGQDPTEEEIHTSIRNGVVQGKFAPVLMGSAFKNKGVQLLIDAICKYLPAPDERQRICFDQNAPGTEIMLKPDHKEDLVALAFKLEENKNNQMTWIRVYQGELRKGATVYNSSVDQKMKVTKLARMNSNELEEIPYVRAGDICAIFGVECASGETFTTGAKYQLNPLHVPDPVISLAITVKINRAVNCL
jgi:elongation factor G